MNDDITNPASETPNGTPYENPVTGAVVTPAAPLAETLPGTLGEAPAEPAASAMPVADDPFKADDASLHLPGRPETSSLPPQQPNKPRGSGGKGKTILWVVIVIVLLAACSFGVYTWQHSQVNSQANQVKDQSSQIKNLQSQIDKLKADAKKTMPADMTNTNIIKLPELGVQITVPDSLKDLTYTISTSKLTSGESFTSADLTTKSLLASDPACTTAKGPLGAITKATGTYPSKPTLDNAAGQLVKQFDGYYIGNVTPQSACSANKATQDMTISQLAALKTALITVAPISGSMAN